MNFLAIISLIVFLSFTYGLPEGYPPPDVLEMIKPLHEICTQKWGVSDDEVTNYKIEDKSEKMMCYMRCLGWESKWMDKDSSLRTEFIMDTVPASIADIIRNILNKCKDISGGEHECEKAYNIQKCAKDADPEHWFLP